jgi:hypothetical protein
MMEIALVVRSPYGRPAEVVPVEWRHICCFARKASVGIYARLSGFHSTYYIQ